MSQSTIRTRTINQETAENSNPTWARTAKAALQAATKDKGKAVPRPLPTKADRDRAVRVTSIPRMTIKGNLGGIMPARIPEISRPIAGRTMF